jgi:tetratricopeptide (TPR) repeat protein/uncharacterized protein (AIM24 family)
VTASTSQVTDWFGRHLSRAREMVTDGRFREAEVEVLRALAVVPTDARALHVLALIRFKLGHLEEARGTYREIATISPNDATAHLNLGLLALKLERVEEAIPDLESATQLAPSDRRAWSYLGFALSRRGDRGAAASAFRRAGQEALAAQLESEDPRGPAEELFAGRRPRARQASADGQEAEAHGASPPPGEVLPDAEPLRDDARPLALALPDEAAPEPAPDTSPDQHLPFFEPALSADRPGLHLVSFVLSRLEGRQLPPAAAQPLLLSVSDEAHVRSDVALASVVPLGSSRWERARRRVRGRMGEEWLGPGEQPFYRLVGPGQVWVAGPPGHWTGLALEDDILYLREDRVLAFDGSVSWEAGRVPGVGVRMLQFRGSGFVAVELDGEPAAVKLSEDAPTLVKSSRLLGWVGRVVAQRHGTQGASGGPFHLSCEGEGVLLFELGAASPAPAPPQAAS